MSSIGGLSEKMKRLIGSLRSYNWILASGIRKGSIVLYINRSVIHYRKYIPAEYEGVKVEVILCDPPILLDED